MRCDSSRKEACAAAEDPLVLCVAARWCDACRLVLPHFLAAADVTPPLGLQCALVIVDAETSDWDWVEARIGVTEVPKGIRSVVNAIAVASDMLSDNEGR